MLLSKIMGVVTLLEVLIRIHCRKVELYFLSKRAGSQLEHIDTLASIVGVAFRDRTSAYSAIQRFTLSDMGYAFDGDGVMVSTLCWNAPIALTIHLDEKPQLGLGIEFRGKSLCIRQMQGVAGASSLDDIRDWPEIMVRACMEFAQQRYFREVRIYKANQHIDFKYPALKVKDEEDASRKVKELQNRMRHRYDRVAQKLKFKRKKRYYVWEIPTKA